MARGFDEVVAAVVVVVVVDADPDCAPGAPGARGSDEVVVADACEAAAAAG